MEILAKLGASLSGFWWSLDERERILVAAGGLYLTLSALAIVGAGKQKQERGELVDEVTRRVLANLEARRGA